MSGNGETTAHTRPLTVTADPLCSRVGDATVDFGVVMAAGNHTLSHSASCYSETSASQPVPTTTWSTRRRSAGSSAAYSSRIQSRHFA